MKFFSMIPRMVSCATTVVFSSIFLATSFSPASANHNSPASLKARVEAVGTLQIAETTNANTNDADNTVPEDGEMVYNTSCATCHTSGIAGAPVLGKSDDWADRIKLGIDTLTKHAIQGFSGSSGVMPAKGGNPALSDDAVTAAVQYMVNQFE